LRQLIPVIRQGINAKRWAQVRFDLERARALVKALPTGQTAQEREQLIALRKKYTRLRPSTPAIAAKLKSNGARAGATARKPAKKSAAPKRAAGKAATPSKRPAPVHIPDLSDRLLNRAALGYDPPNTGGGPA
jgi:hypothetical protein